MAIIATYWNILFLIIIFLDFTFPNPNFSLHPIRLIGHLINFLENKFYHLNINKYFSGFLFLLSTIFLSTIFFVGIVFLLFQINFWLGTFFYVLITFLFLSTRTLTIEGDKVINYIEKGEIEKARKVSQGLVSRNMQKEDKDGIIRATIESMAENMSDGVVAPIIFLIIFGFPGLVIYKTVNTLDSMVGYKNKRYLKFGFFSAKLDDVFNFIPARITGLLIVIQTIIFNHSFKGSIISWYKYGQSGESPNGGIPICAFAGAVNIKLGGDVHDENNNKKSVPVVGGKNKVDLKNIKQLKNYINISVLILMVLWLISFFVL